MPHPPWSSVRPKFVYVFEWWHDEVVAMQPALYFAEHCWVALAAESPEPANASDTAELALQVLSICFLWRGYLIDFGVASPAHTDDWRSIAEWIDFNAWTHFGTDDPKRCESALARDLATRTEALARKVGQRRLRELLPSPTLAAAESVENLIAATVVDQVAFDVLPLVHAQFDDQRLISLSTHRDQLVEYLDRIPCPFRLNPLRIVALDVVLPQPISPQLESKIILPLSVRNLEDQFIHDFKIFGLGEAIVFLGSAMQDLDRMEPELLRSICNVYHLVAYLYLANHFKLEASNDPRVATPLGLLHRLGDGRHTHLQGLRMNPLPPTRCIEAPAKPARTQGYRRRLQLPEMVAEMPFLHDDSTEPQSFSDELVEHLTLSLLRSFNTSTIFFEVAHTIREHGIDPYSSSGQYILSSIASAMQFEIEHCDVAPATCVRCSNVIPPAYELPLINQVLQTGAFVCADCFGADTLP